uniref:SRCR domain-containing protein n=1 Tax=Neogobius melanostomus TaxID=47308 RepID=A0A8C6UU99_9GOBI
MNPSLDCGLIIYSLKRAPQRRPWCLTVIVVYLILQTPLNIFLLYKVFSLQSSVFHKSAPTSAAQSGGPGDIPAQVQNNSQETQIIRGQLWTLQHQVENLCGAEGQIQKLQTNVGLLNSSTLRLDSRIQAISLIPGRYVDMSLQSVGVMFCHTVALTFFVAGEKGDPGVVGPTGEQGNTSVSFDQKLTWVITTMLYSYSHMCPETVRLVPGPARGRVEVFYNGQWGTVCDDSFDTVDARVICKMLGYRSSLQTYPASPGTGKIWLDELQCRGTETDIFNCPHLAMGINDCNHNEDVGLQCV